MPGNATGEDSAVGKKHFCYLRKLAVVGNGWDDADSAAEDGRAIPTIIAFVAPLTSRNRGCRKRDAGQTNQWSHAEGLGGSPSKQLFLSPSLEPLLPLLILRDVFDMLLMSLGPGVFFHRADWLGGPGAYLSRFSAMWPGATESLPPAFLPVSAQGRASSAGWEITC
ncbi:hypothetical protein EYF80_025035 [Liparis tanakae]|uniref:Uncharacterized protein n=1 Tax=Liparis tanakae TaxID=230148 RepID=A0A4Z2HFV1_9TELE|nr:hypothetical protein EYF80_025035 [Liparis tanakae]